MTWESALDNVVARTRHERFRVLCSEDWPDHKAYRELVIRMAAGEGSISDPPAPIPLAESLDLLRLVNLCQYRSRDAACGCSGSSCALRVSAPIVSHLDCLECVRCYGHA